MPIERRRRLPLARPTDQSDRRTLAPQQRCLAKAVNLIWVEPASFSQALANTEGRFSVPQASFPAEPATRLGLEYELVIARRVDPVAARPVVSATRRLAATPQRCRLKLSEQNCWRR